MKNKKERNDRKWDLKSEIRDKIENLKENDPDIERKKKELYLEYKDKVIKIKDYDSIIWMAEYVSEHRDSTDETIEKYENAIIKSNDVYDCYNFAINVKGANIKELGNAVLRSKSKDEAKLNCCKYFASRLHGKDILPFEKVILESKNPRHCWFFARDIEGANIKAFSEIIFKSKDPCMPNMCCEIASNLHGKGIQPYEEAVLKTKNPIWSWLFVQYVEEQIYRHIGKLYLKVKANT